MRLNARAMPVTVPRLLRQRPDMGENGDMKKRLVRALACFGALMLIAGSGTASAAEFTPGSAGLGDPMFPNAGNGGYDVQNYNLTLDYSPASNQLLATAVITATATQSLS